MTETQLWLQNTNKVWLIQRQEEQREYFWSWKTDVVESLGKKVETKDLWGKKIFKKIKICGEGTR